MWSFKIISTAKGPIITMLGLLIQAATFRITNGTIKLESRGHLQLFTGMIKSLRLQLEKTLLTIVMGILKLRSNILLKIQAKLRVYMALGMNCSQPKTNLLLSSIILKMKNVFRLITPQGLNTSPNRIRFLCPLSS